MKFAKFVSMIFSLLLAQAVSAHALSVETVANLPCLQVTQAGIARQSWSAGGAPYGAPLIEWNAQTFGALRQRISECFGQMSGDLRGLLAYVQRLEGMVQLQNAQSQAAADRKSRARDNIDLAARRDARSMEDRERSQAAYERMVRQRDEEALSANASRDKERELLTKVEAFTSQDELKSFCGEVWRSQLPENTRVSVISNCKRRLQLMAISDQEQQEARRADASRRLLPELIQKVKQMPADHDTVRQLQDLKSDNHYRLPSLSFSDQNSYLQAIESRLAEIGGNRIEAKCATVLTKISIPSEIREAIIIDGLDGISLTRFLCGPVLTTRNVSVGLGPNDSANIKVEALTLTFVRRRYLPNRRAEVALDSPIEGGVNALVLTGAADGANRLPIGNPNFFVINFYSQFTPQVAAFLAQ